VDTHRRGGAFGGFGGFEGLDTSSLTEVDTGRRRSAASSGRPTQERHSTPNLAAPQALAAAWRYVDAEDTYMWAINITSSGGYYTDLTW
jgi:hypothetical protein